MIGAIEAPFPYLYGAVTSHLLDCDIDVSNIVWIDLDNRTVSMPALSEENPDVAAPTSLKVSLVKDINDIIMTPVANWMQRSCRVARQSDVDNTNRISFPNEKLMQLVMMTNHLLSEDNMLLHTQRSPLIGRQIRSFNCSYALICPY